MKSKIRLSKYALILTIIVNIVLIVCCILTYKEEPIFWVILSILIVLLLFGLLYGPTKIIANSEYLIIKSRLLKRHIRIRNIDSVELFQPTM